MSTIRVIIKRPGEKPEATTIEDRYETYRDLVGGFIENVYLEDGVIAIINEEGKLTGLPGNFTIPSGDLIVGTAVFVKDDGEGGCESVSPELEAKVIAPLFAPKKQDAFGKWLDTFVAEKGIPLTIWTFDVKYGIRVMDSAFVLEALKKSPEATKAKLKTVFVQMDFLNAPVSAFLTTLESIGRALAAQGR